MTKTTNNYKNLQLESQVFEHNYLRTEIETNKKFVFERALIIVGAALAAMLLPQGLKVIPLLGIPVIGALSFNLWFTANRLKSNARIIAYIQLFHESIHPFSWIGWENALRLYRLWHKYENCEEEVEQARAEFAGITQWDNLSFYSPILTLHIAMAVAIAFLMSFIAWITAPLLTPFVELPQLFLHVANGSALLIFIVWAFFFYKPNNLTYEIQKSLVIWKAVFKSYEKGQLKEELKNDEIVFNTNSNN